MNEHKYSFINLSFENNLSPKATVTGKVDNIHKLT